MILDIRFNEIIKEIKEELELQAGLVFDESQIKSLRINQQVVFKEIEIKPYLKDITEYLSITSPSERVWDCYKVLSDNTYIITIHLETPFISLDTFNLLG